MHDTRNHLSYENDNETFLRFLQTSQHAEKVDYGVSKRFKAALTRSKFVFFEQKNVFPAFQRCKDVLISLNSPSIIPNSSSRSASHFLLIFYFRNSTIGKLSSVPYLGKSWNKAYLMPIVASGL